MKFIEIPISRKALKKRKLIFGIGVNDSNYVVIRIISGKQVSCPYYVKWRSMLMRCYNNSFLAKNPSYNGCSVAHSWLYFTNFRLWMMRQKWQGLDLDKDLKISGNKVYSPESCLFVSHAVNSLLIAQNSSRGKYPQGVAYCKINKNFVARGRYDGKKYHIGSFSSAEQASSAYRLDKAAIIIKAALDPENSNIKQYLLKYANEYEAGQ